MDNDCYWCGRTISDPMLATYEERMGEGHDFCCENCAMAWLDDFVSGTAPEGFG